MNCLQRRAATSLSLVLLASFAGHPARGDFNLVTGPGSPGNSNIKQFEATTASQVSSFLAYPAGVNFGFRVAVGDVTGDKTPDIVTGLGPGGQPTVKVFDGVTLTETASFNAYGTSFSGGVYVAAGDVTGDKRADVITGAGENGNGHVKVFDDAGGAEVRSFFAYSGFTGEVRVAAGDIDGDGVSDIITGAGPGAGPHVKAFSGADNSELRSFFAYAPNYTGGVYVAAGDVDGDGRADVITGAGAAGGTHVKAFSGLDGSELRSFFAYPGVNLEVRVAAGDVNGDGVDDILTGLGPGSGSTHVKAFDGVTLDQLGSFFAYNASFAGGVYVAGFSAVPEPTSVALAGVAVAGFAVRRRTR